MSRVRIAACETGFCCEARQTGHPPNEYVDVFWAGVCGTDLQIAGGLRPDVADPLGHEGVGQLSSGGGWVVFNPVDLADQDRILGHSVPGVFEDRVTVDRARAWPQTVVLRDDLVGPIGVLVEPLAAVTFGWELIGVLHGIDAVGIWGAGPVGLLHCIEARRRGIRHTLIHNRLPRLAWAKMRHLAVGDDAGLPGSLDANSIDLAILCVPRNAAHGAIWDAVTAVRPGGAILLVGGTAQHHPALASPSLAECRRSNTASQAGGWTAATAPDGKRLLVSGHRGTSPDHLTAAQKMLAAGSQDYEQLLTHICPPQEAAELMCLRLSGAQRDRNGREIVKIVIDFSGLHGS